MRPAPFLLVLLAAAAGPTGCGEEAAPPTLVFRLYGPSPPLPGGGCPAPAVGPALPPVGGDANTLRLTYRAAGTGRLLCDAVIPLGEPAPVVAVPDDDGAPAVADVYAELFRINAGSVVLISSGSTRGVDLGAATEVAVRVTPAEAFSCAPAPAAVARAFHSATLLPGGEILVIGGVVGAAGATSIDPDAPAGALYATDQVEVIDPVSGATHAIVVTGLLPRALHAAFVLAGADANVVRIAVVGGATVAGDALTTPLLRAGLAADPFPLVPTDDALAAPTEILTYDRAAGTITRELVTPALAATPRLFAAQATAPPMVAGGWADPAREMPVATFQTIDGASAQADDGGDLAAPRYGATLTSLGSAGLLAWGGVLDAAEPALPPGEVIPLLVGPPGPVVFEGSVRRPAARALHAAAAVGDGDVLVVGGLAVAGGRARAAAAPLAERILLGPPVESIEVQAPAAAAPVVWAEVTPLADGGVLVSGGHPDPNGTTCPADAGLRCATGTSLRYRSAALAAVGPLVVSRFGHRAVALADGRVVVTGGLGAGADGLVLLADVESFNPATAADDPIRDLAPDIVRAPGDIARTIDARPAAPCTLIDP